MRIAYYKACKVMRREKKADTVRQSQAHIVLFILLVHSRLNSMYATERYC